MPTVRVPHQRIGRNDVSQLARALAGFCRALCGKMATQGESQHRQSEGNDEKQTRAPPSVGSSKAAAAGFSGGNSLSWRGGTISGEGERTRNSSTPSFPRHSTISCKSLRLSWTAHFRATRKRL